MTFKASGLKKVRVLPLKALKAISAKTEATNIGPGRHCLSGLLFLHALAG